MRITQSMVTRNLLAYINSNRESMNETQNSIASGKELNSVSDDPVKFSMISRYKETQMRNEQYIENILDAMGWLDASNGVLEDLYDYTLTAKDIAYQAADDTINEDDRLLLVERLDKIIEDVVGLANSKYLGKYIFSGTKTLEESPFSEEGDEIVYRGNSRSISRRIADNIDVDINISGSRLMDTELFNNLTALRDGLATNDREAISASIDTLESSAEKLMSINTNVGLLKNQLELAQNRLEISNTNLDSLISDLEDVDMAKAIAQYNAEEIAYEAALQAISNTLNISLLNFLE
jgi:flagellar hook-associated protein 3 FlgL